MRNTNGAKKEPNYAGIMLDALKGQLCSKLCWHNIRTPTVQKCCISFGGLSNSKVISSMDDMTFDPRICFACHSLSCPNSKRKLFD